MIKPIFGSQEQFQADYWSKMESKIKGALKPEFAKLNDTIVGHAKDHQGRFDSTGATLSQILKRLDP